MYNTTSQLCIIPYNNYLNAVMVQSLHNVENNVGGEIAWKSQHKNEMRNDKTCVWQQDELGRTEKERKV